MPGLRQRNLCQLWVIFTQTFRHGHRRATEDADQLQSIGNSFPLKVVVGDNENDFGIARDLGDTLSPGFKLLEIVEVVIPLFGMFVGGKPVFVVAPVQPHVPHRHGDLVC